MDDAIDKLNRYFDNVFEKVIYFDGSKTAVFRPDSYMLLADVVLTFTKWTDDYRVDLRNPSILAKGINSELKYTGRLLGFHRCTLFFDSTLFGIIQVTNPVVALGTSTGGPYIKLKLMSFYLLLFLFFILLTASIESFNLKLSDDDPVIDNIKTSLTDYNKTVSIENYPQFQEMENAFVVMFPTLTFAGLVFPAYVTFKREAGHRFVAKGKNVFGSKNY